MTANLNEHTQVSELLPLYLSGVLDRDQRLVVEKHLPGCAECQADLALWRVVSGEIVANDQAVTAPCGLPDQALADARLLRKRTPGVFDRVPHPMLQLGVLLRSQMPLVHREIWPASALVIALGYIAALISARSVFVYVLAPLVTAACVSLIYGPENDPAYELTLATPTSPRQILLARLVLVFGYNLALVLAATLGMLPILSGQPLVPLLGSLVLSWLAPMTFLSAGALVLSVWIGAPNAITLTYLTWLAQLLVGPLRSPQTGLGLSPVILSVMTAYQNFWQASGLLLTLSAVLVAAAVWLAGRQDMGLPNPA